ncbi:amidohydrolase family protein [Sphingomonas sp. CCH5-D11]|uniref:amidohydrolase family protein n=1 Tax=Sphingomonas sp. CCH5-D11 TaxID=1768786 RepID=UPI00082B8AB7|nr:amidohydrolase family protein [Sphingomonas sp. CCH5-D11]
MAQVAKNLPVEVELAFEVMPCQAMRRSYDSGAEPHACGHFAEWGLYHSYDYKEQGPPTPHGIVHDSVYIGKRPVVPEMLSGCRKSPILAVGINPNLPGWAASSRNAIHPYFDDYLQYAHYFRWRTTDKLRIPRGRYQALLGDRDDNPGSGDPLIEPGSPIEVERSSVTMYRGYQSLLDGLGERMGWSGHQLQIGEDFAYANMVACGSARWTTRPVQDMPVMGEARARSIVRECFRDRRYFLRQMLHSLPRVVMIFSQTTANAFIAAMSAHFTKGDPRPQEPLSELMEREVRLRFGRAADGEELEARVVFSPHVSARPEEFAAARERLIGHLEAEARAGRLELNPETGHLRRPRGGCQFCENALYSIGTCGYRAELRPLGDQSGILPLADGGATGDTAAERAAHLGLVDAFTGTGGEQRGESADSEIVALDDAAPLARRLALRGHVVPMSGPPIADGAVYLDRGSIVAVQPADAAPPAGFEQVPLIDTGGAIYPGLSDLHNHLAYNILSLWWPAAARSNRSQWLRDPEYKRLVSMPMEIVAGRQDLIRALVRYVEVKLMLGGVTSGQGMVSKYRNGPAFSGLVRNFERSDDPDLMSIRHRVPDVRDDDLPKVRKALDAGTPYFFHLAEGTDARARAQFTLLANDGLIRANLVGVHSLGLQAQDLNALGAGGASVVWSPFSNSALYGRTLRVQELLGSGVRFALGSDWTPSGSRNLLEEMKIARLTAEAEGADLGAEQLARAVTREAADIAGWGHRLGRLAADYYADLIVVERTSDDPYENLLNATEREIRLVVIAGHPRHGERDLMEACGVAAAKLEAITVGGREKALNLEHPSSPLNNISFADAGDALRRALADLPGARDTTFFEPFAAGPELEIELDMQSPEPEPGEIEPLAEVTLPDSVPFDEPTVVDDQGYWEVLDSIPHLPAFLKGSDGLRRYYREG